MAAKAGWGFIDTAIKSVDAPRPDTVVLHLKYAWAPMLADLALFANGIVPNNYGGKSETAFYQAPVGTGPFKWDYWHKGSALKLVKNTNYWEPGKPYLDSVTWTYVPDDNTRQLQVKGGQAQIDQYPAWSTVTALKSTPGVTLSLFPSTETTYLGFNENVEAVPGRARAPGDLLSRSTAARWSRPCCSATGRRPTRSSRPRCRTTTPAAGACSSTPRRPRPSWPSRACRTGFTTTLQVPSGNSD